MLSRVDNQWYIVKQMKSIFVNKGNSGTRFGALLLPQVVLISSTKPIFRRFLFTTFASLIIEHYIKDFGSYVKGKKIFHKIKVNTQRSAHSLIVYSNYGHNSHYTVTLVTFVKKNCPKKVSTGLESFVLDIAMILTQSGFFISSFKFPKPNRVGGS